MWGVSQAGGDLRLWNSAISHCIQREISKVLRMVFENWGRGLVVSLKRSTGKSHTAFFFRWVCCVLGICILPSGGATVAGRGNRRRFELEHSSANLLERFLSLPRGLLRGEGIKNPGSGPSSNVLKQPSKRVLDFPRLYSNDIRGGLKPSSNVIRAHSKTSSYRPSPYRNPASQRHPSLQELLGWAEMIRWECSEQYSLQLHHPEFFELLHNG